MLPPDILLVSSPKGPRTPTSVYTLQDPPLHNVRNMYACSISYIIFTMTDGAARMLVLLHANTLGFNPIEIALMFALYEVMGIVTNLYGGFMGSQYGLRTTLLFSLLLQCIGLVALAYTKYVFGALEHAAGKTRWQAFVWIALCQAFNGCAKDLMKLGGKSSPKLVTPAGDNNRLFQLVAYLTGMKNTMKGFGFFLGGILLSTTGYRGALWTLTGFIIVLLPICLMYIDKTLGMSNNRPTCAEVFQKPHNVQVLSCARFFLFGSRDVWFEIAAPLYLADAMGWESFSVGAFMAGYTIIYGQFQALATKLFKRKDVVRSPGTTDVQTLASVLCIIPGLLGLLLYCIRSYDIATQVFLICGIALYAIVFAVNSSVHSYMIVKFSNRDKVSHQPIKTQMTFLSFHHFRWPWIWDFITWQMLLDVW